jgi:hypothetical protein
MRSASPITCRNMLTISTDVRHENPRGQTQKDKLDYREDSQWLKQQ